jgi:hypothetical protein
MFRGHRNGSPLLYSRLSRPKPLLFLSSSSSIVPMRLGGPRSRPTTWYTDIIIAKCVSHDEAHVFPTNRWIHESEVTYANGSHVQACRRITNDFYDALWRIIFVFFHENTVQAITKKTPWSESASELYRPSDRRSSAKWLPTFADKGCHVVSVTDPYGRILGFLDKSRYFSIK